MKKIVIILLVLCMTLGLAACGLKEKSSTDSVRMIMVDDKIYKDTGEVNTSERLCGTLNGYIETRIDSDKTPTENNQANFDGGVGYQYGMRGDTIEIFIDKQWVVFNAE